VRAWRLCEAESERARLGVVLRKKFNLARCRQCGGGKPEPRAFFDRQKISAALFLQGCRSGTPSAGQRQLRSAPHDDDVRECEMREGMCACRKMTKLGSEGYEVSSGTKLERLHIHDANGIYGPLAVTLIHSANPPKIRLAAVNWSKLQPVSRAIHGCWIRLSPNTPRLCA